MFQTDFNSDLKEKPDLKSRQWFILFGKMPEFVQVFLNKRNKECNFVNIPEHA